MERSTILAFHPEEPLHHLRWRTAKGCSLASLVLVFIAVLVIVLPAPQQSGLQSVKLGTVDSSVVPTQAFVDFIACTTSDGSSCLGTDGGLDPNANLDVGTSISLDVETSVLSCSSPVTATVDWGDGSAKQSLSGAPGSIGPFSHTYNSAGTFGLVIGDSCDGTNDPIYITISGGLSSLAPIFGSAGIFLGLIGVVLALVSFRGPKRPHQQPPVQTPQPVVYGSVIGTPTGPAGVTTTSSMNIPPPPPAVIAAGGYPPWAYDYRTTPFTPNLWVTGWTELVSKSPNPPPDPVWPGPQTPNPPTNYPGVFCQPRVNPQTGRLRWWNPVDGSFPWGP
jgi:hypothetical protein